jgi:apolipoprotein N-acyltransferase
MLRSIDPVFGSRFSVLGKAAFLCVCAGLLLVLPFQKFNFEFLAWIGFAPLFLALKNASKLKAFFLSYLTGAVFWLGTIYWLVHVTSFGMFLLALYLALYFGIFGFIVSGFLPRFSIFNFLFIPSLWVILEYVRSYLLTGFPWALLGYSQYLNLPVIQIADITGVWGVSFLVMLVNITIYSVLGSRFSVLGGIKKYLIPLVCVVFTVGYGFYKLHHTPNTTHPAPLKISVIQGNIPQELKWDRRAKDFIINKYLGLTAQANKDNPGLIIWPEAAMPVVFGEEPEYFEKVKSAVKEAATPLLLGMVRSREDMYYNSAALISKEGTFLTSYDKIHLVPFGEYIPLRKLLPFLETVVPIGEFAGGKEYTVFDVAAKAPESGARFSVLICFEDVFPELARRFVIKGAHFLVNITNDAWFQATSAPYQHLAASVFRAVENRVVLVRAANTGISAFISSKGGSISRVAKTGKDIFVDGYKTEEIPAAGGPLSFYTRYGDIFVFLCFVVVACGIVKIFFSSP